MKKPYIWVALLGAAIYFKALFFGFTYLDDNVLILNNADFLSRFSSVFEAFRKEVFLNFGGLDAYYRPALNISFILDAQFAGAANPFFYHLSNIIYHIAASLLLVVFLAELGYPRKASAFVGILFVSHPVLTQAVAWIPGRNDTLLAVFALSAFICFSRFLKGRHWQDYALNVLFFAAALYTKETALALVPVCLLYVFVASSLRGSPKGDRSNLLAMVIGWALVTAVWLLMRNAALTRPLEMAPSAMAMSFAQNLPALVQYIGKIIFPFNLSVLPIIRDTTFIYGIAALALVIFAVIVSKKKRMQNVSFGAAWFFLFLAPSLIRPNPAIAADFIEHRLYLPLCGFIVILMETDLGAIATLRWTRDEGRGTIFLIFIIILFSAITFTHADNFRNRIAFWENAARNSAHLPLAHRNLGAMYYLDGGLDKAEAEYKKALELNEYEPMAYNNLGLIYMQNGRFGEAEEMFKKELSFNPGYDDALFNYGLLLSRTARQEDARRLWQRALEANPDYTDARAALNAAK